LIKTNIIQLLTLELVAIWIYQPEKYNIHQAAPASILTS